MSYLLGSGWWIPWHLLLWLSVTPFVAATAYLARATPNESMEAMEQAFAVGTVGVFVLMIATAISGYLWTAGGSPEGAWPYVRNMAGAALAALLFGFVFIFGAGYYAVTPGLPMVNRWAAQLLSLTSALALVLFCVHAAWRFRHR
jgi:hypothetical protein